MIENINVDLEQEARLEFQGYIDWLDEQTPESRKRHERQLMQRKLKACVKVAPRRVINTMDIETRKGKLLEHYSKKSPEKYYQIDSFNEFDDVIGSPDDNGVACLGGVTWELMNSPFVVRVLVKENANYQDIAASLKSTLGWLEKDKCSRCNKTFSDHHSACKDKTLTDEQVQAIVQWENRSPEDDNSLTF